MSNGEKKLFNERPKMNGPKRHKNVGSYDTVRSTQPFLSSASLLTFCSAKAELMPYGSFAIDLMYSTVQYECCGGKICTGRSSYTQPLGRQYFDVKSSRSTKQSFRAQSTKIVPPKISSSSRRSRFIRLESQVLVLILVFPTCQPRQRGGDTWSVSRQTRATREEAYEIHAPKLSCTRRTATDLSVGG